MFIDQDVAGEIAVAGMPPGIDELPDAGLAVELATDAIGRCWRARNAEQRIDLVEVGTAECQGDIGASPFERILHRALGRQAGAGISDLEVERIGFARVA